MSADVIVEIGEHIATVLKIAGSEPIANTSAIGIVFTTETGFAFFGVRRFAAALFGLLLLKTEQSKAAAKRRTPKKAKPRKRR